MPITAMTVRSERWLDQLLLVATTTSDAVGLDFSESFSLPVTLGDVAIMEIRVGFTPIATLHANPEVLGIAADIVSGDGSTRLDIVGLTNAGKMSTTSIECYFSPDPLVIWRNGELLNIRGPELDTNVTPTGDLQVFAKVVRVRHQQPGAQPVGAIRLVR